MDCEHKKSTRVTMNHALPSKKLRNATLFHLRVLGHFPSWLHRQPRGTQCQRQSVARKERETLVMLPPSLLNSLWSMLPLLSLSIACNQ